MSSNTRIKISPLNPNPIKAIAIMLGEKLKRANLALPASHPALLALLAALPEPPAVPQSPLTTVPQSLTADAPALLQFVFALQLAEPPAAALIAIEKINEIIAHTTPTIRTITNTDICFIPLSYKFDYNTNMRLAFILCRQEYCARRVFCT
jgi:hypothetical protein